MHKNIGSLIALMPPHEGAGDRVDWDRSRAVWGTRFPSEFVEFMAVYGAGSISDVLWVTHQNEGGPGDGPYNAWYTPMQDWLIEMSAPYPAWPEPGSLISWGGDANENTFFWSTRGSDPDQWPVVVWEAGAFGSEAFIEFECGMVEFLLRVLGEPKSRPFDEGFVAGISRPRFLHEREEARIRERGINPWQME